MKKMKFWVIIYLIVGVIVTGFRFNSEPVSHGGPEILFAYLIYPVCYPYFEMGRISAAKRQQEFRAGMKRTEVALLCPPAFEAQLSSRVLAPRGDTTAASYKPLLDALHKNKLDVADARSGYVLWHLTRATKNMGDVSRARTDAAEFRRKGDISSLCIAAAILHGAYSLEPHDKKLLHDMLPVYERIHVEDTLVGRVTSGYALGTLYAALGMPDKALSSYEAVLRSRRIDVGMQALVHAAEIARDDEQRQRLLNAFCAEMRGQESWLDLHFKRVFSENGLDFGSFSTFTCRYEGAQVLGWRLRPLRVKLGDDEFDRFEGFLMQSGFTGNGGLGQHFRWWKMLVLRLEPAFTDFPAKLALVESVLDTVLNSREHADIKSFFHEETREVYYQLYAETGEERWLQHALSSQLKIRPALQKFAEYIRGEVALMRGEYREHFRQTVRRYLAHRDYAALPAPYSFMAHVFNGLEIRVRGEKREYEYALEDYQRDTVNALHERQVSPAEGLRLYDANALPPPFHDFKDSDVYKRNP